jgi:hypothetical protein
MKAHEEIMTAKWLFVEAEFASESEEILSQLFLDTASCGLFSSPLRRAALPAVAACTNILERWITVSEQSGAYKSQFIRSGT